MKANDWYMSRFNGLYMLLAFRYLFVK